MTDRIYLDWNATAPLRPQAYAAMLAALAETGNPSSVHAAGRAARRRVEEARESLAALVGGDARDVVLTSGGTEANMLALAPTIGARSFDRLLVSAIEHPSVLSGARFPAAAVEILPVDRQGVLDLYVLANRLEASTGRALVSVMLANNETGIVQPVSQAAALVHAAGGVLHVDAVQAVGRIPCDIRELGADFLTVSGHKIGAPQGVGALIRSDPALEWPYPLIRGGGQERGARAGTENVPAIAGLGAAAAAVRAGIDAEAAEMTRLRDRLEAGLRAASSDVLIFGAEVARLPNTTLFALPGVKAETAVIALDLAGAAVSSGAACSSGKVQASHVLAAMGAPTQLARAAVRVSLGPTTTEFEIDRFIDAWIGVSGALLRTRPDIAA
jgi:cysteine desulfurase